MSGLVTTGEIPFVLESDELPEREATASVHLGAAGEAWCKQQHDAMRMRRIAKVKKINPATFGAQGRLTFAKKTRANATVDFGGYMVGSRIIVAIEAKAFAGDRLPLSVVKPHQRELLDEYDDDGCIAILVALQLRCDRHGHALPYVQNAFAIPWWKARLALKTNRKGTEYGSLLVRDIAQFRVTGSDLYLEPWVTR